MEIYKELRNILLVLFLLLADSPSPVKCTTDPCSLTNPPAVPNLLNRRPNSGSSGIDDGSITEGWYSGIGLEIITFQVPSYSCGSKHAVWATGPVHRSNIITNLVLKYSNTSSGAGDENIFIDAKYCGDYIMYKLKPVPGVSYCFDFRSSSDENIPVYVPPKATISVGLQFTSSGGYNWPGLVFGCEFDRQVNESLTYLVVFSANKTPLTILHVDSDPASLAVINEKSLVDLGFGQGVSMSCSVGVRNTSTSPVGNLVHSPDYFAGIKVNSTDITLNRGDMVEIEVEPTVPFGCHSGRANCNIDILVSSKDKTTKDNCVATRIVVEGSNHCGPTVTGKTYLDTNWIKNKEWGGKRKINLKHFIEQDLVYDLDRSRFDMEIKIPFSDHQFWSNTKIADIQVRVEDNNDIWKGKKTGGHCDPHMQTFDGIPYELHFPGRFIAYSHETLHIQVHVEITSCFNNDKTPYCVCGIAIVAGQDVFMLYTCGKYKIIDYTLCEENVLKVLRFDSKYVIYLPTGTKIVASLVQLDVVLWDYDIYPSISDVNSTSGLAGSLDGDCSNDFHLRQGCKQKSKAEGSEKTCDDHTRTYSFQPDDFSASFELSESENLFPPYQKKAYKALLPYKKENLFCHCQNDEGNNVTTVCSTLHYWSCNDTLKTVSCLITSNPFADPQSNKTNVITEADARAKCEEVIKTSETFKKCRSLNIDEANSAVETCVLDVMATGDLMWADFALDRSNEACLQTIKKNATLRHEHTVLASEIEMITCPRGCSRNGLCVNGTCKCFNDFAGYDCSTNITGAPKVDGIARGKYCDEGSGCDAFYIQGPKFIEDQPYVCQYKSTKIKPDGTRCCEKTETKPAEGRTTFEIKCPLPERKKDNDGFAVEYNTSVATKYGEFSNGVVGYSYDARCQTYKEQTDGISFDLKDKYCFLDGACVKNGMKNPTQPCYYCESHKDPLKWTTFSNKSECAVADTESPEEDNTAVVAGAIAGAIAGVAALSAVAAIVVKKVVIGSALSQAAVFQAAGGVAFPTPNAGLGPGKATFSGL